MKNIWALTVLFVLAGCQPDVQESPVVQPVSEAKPELQTETISIPSESPKAPAKIAAVSQSEKSAQPKFVPEKVTREPEPHISPPVLETTRIAEPAKIEKSAVSELPVAIAAPQTSLSEAEAMSLAKKKNCFACHALDKKVVGPAWRVVAEKYRSDAGAQAMLEAKVRKGGKGVWGSVAMPPQSALSGEELTGLVQFVLQLK